MADNDQNNDEYNFAELDSMDNETMADIETKETTYKRTSQNPFSDRKDILRNGLIAIGLIIFAFVLYKFLGSMFTKKPEPTTPVIQPIAQDPQPVQTVVTPVPAQPTPVAQVDPDLKQKVAAMDIAQQSIRTEVSSLSDQVGGVNSTINNLNTEVAKLNQVITELSNLVTKQSQEISILMVRTQPKVVKVVKKQILVQRITYYIQAVIPGRAWLIGSNGSTLTVREGTKIAGYGVVKLIDSIQGRVLTSSGQVIKFSQEDS